MCDMRLLCAVCQCHHTGSTTVTPALEAGSLMQFCQKTVDVTGLICQHLPQLSLSYGCSDADFSRSVFTKFIRSGAIVFSQ